MHEKEIEAKVRDYARERGVTAYKFTSPSRAAVPDRLLAFPGGLAVFIEFKQTGKKPTAPQWREIDRLRGKGFNVYVCDSVETGRMLVDWHTTSPHACPFYLDPKRPQKK